VISATTSGLIAAPRAKIAIARPIDHPLLFVRKVGNDFMQEEADFIPLLRAALMWRRAGAVHLSEGSLWRLRGVRVHEWRQHLPVSGPPQEGADSAFRVVAFVSGMATTITSSATTAMAARVRKAAL
jgi:hypothetical protein